MKSDAEENTFFAQIIVEELIRNRVELFCISPGHRSAALAASIAFYTTNKAGYRVFIDERSAAYFAIGFAKVGSFRKPRLVCLVCTSGTALMNYYPAVVEAYYANLPILILSADRPPELRETGANQTADQVKVFGRFVHYSVDLPCPGACTGGENFKNFNENFNRNNNVDYFLRTIDYAVWQARHCAGPVHINCMFREPFLSQDNPNEVLSRNRSRLPGTWTQNGRPACDFSSTSYQPDQTNLTAAAEIISQTNRGVLLIGSGYFDESTKDSVKELVARLGWPVYPDTLTGGLESSYTCTWFAHFCHEITQIETILILGDRFISKKIYEWIREIHQGQPDQREQSDQEKQ